jgi:hypothetical protein
MLEKKVGAAPTQAIFGILGAMNIEKGPRFARAFPVRSQQNETFLMAP